MHQTIEKNGSSPRFWRIMKPQFSLYAKGAKEVCLEFYQNPKDKTPSRKIRLDPKKNRTGDYWYFEDSSIAEGSLYRWNINGISILDPLALSYTGNMPVEEKKSIFLLHRQSSMKRISIPDKDRLIYEVHIGFFSEKRSYSSFIDKIPYLKELGINTVEFLPIYEWDDYTGNLHPDASPIKNAWGYNPINFFAATKKYSSSKEAASFSEKEEFHHLVEVLHENGIEVLLDVVYNHTAEGGKTGYLYNFKAMGENIFYIKTKEKDFANFSGCGNSFNCNHPVAKEMILDSLLYWYYEIGVDGFRFDLSPVLGRDSDGQWLQHSLLKDLVEHPILSHALLISESWDLGGYFVGALPSGWSEWNDSYRDTVRKFIRGDFGQIPDLIKRIFGSVDLFHANRKKYQSSINFIACHDGFTMWDLLSYNRKYNFANGEQNRDGSNENYSYNHGEEGETDNPNILALRIQQMKNMMLILYISQGIPMLLMGDEIARTQLGNNNAYCQDNKITWMDWSRKERFQDVFIFTKSMIQLRKSYSIFRREEYLKMDEEIFLHGVKLHQPDYSFHSLSIAFELFDQETKTRFYIALNSYSETLEFELPLLGDGKHWYLLTDTAKPETCYFQADEMISGKSYSLTSKSSMILIAK